MRGGWVRGWLPTRCCIFGCAPFKAVTSVCRGKTIKVSRARSAPGLKFCPPEGVAKGQSRVRLGPRVGGQRQRGPQGGDFGVAPLQGKFGRQVFVNLLQIVGVTGAKKFALGGLGDGLLGFLVHLGIKGHTLVTGNEAIGRAKRHGVDAHPALRGLLGGLKRVGASGAAPVGEQHNRPG